MSLLWHELVIVGLAPDRLSALLVQSFLRPLGSLARPRLLDRQVVPLQGQNAAEWDKGMAALENLLVEPAWHGRDIAVVLSGHYVRHAIFPAGRSLTHAERQKLAEAVFRDTFGDLARDWELRVSPPGSGMQTLACGVPRSLLTTLRTICEGRGRLVSIQPCLMPVFNQARREISKQLGCLALVEAGRITLAFAENGQWKYVDSRAGDGNMLPQLLLEEAALSGRQPGGILWLCDLADTARLPADTFWSCKPVAPPRLPGFEGISSLAIWGLA